MEAEPLYSQAVWYYNTSEAGTSVIRYEIDFDEDIDGKLLEKAVELTMKRYPYFKKEIVKKGERYFTRQNDAPIVVLHTDGPVQLCSEQTNYQQLAFAYWNNCLYFINTHSLMDGKGRFMILHTLIYYYCSFYYGEDVEMKDVQLADSPIDPAEYRDPTFCECPEPSFQMPPMQHVPNTAKIERLGLAGEREDWIYTMRIDEQALMKQCRASDSTPNSAISIIMSQAILNLHPDLKDTIVSGVYCDYRSAIHNEKSHHCQVTVLPLSYDRQRMEKLSLSEQNTIFRGKIIMMSDKDSLIPIIKGAQESYKAFDSLNSLQERINLAFAALNGSFDSYTFLVSYSGKTTFGSCDSHILATYPRASTHFSFGMLIEVTAAHGNFFLTFIQNWRTRKYIDEFCRILNSLDIRAEVLSGKRNPYQTVDTVREI